MNLNLSMPQFTPLMIYRERRLVGNKQVASNNSGPELVMVAPLDLRDQAEIAIAQANHHNLEEAIYLKANDYWVHWYDISSGVRTALTPEALWL